MTEKKLYVGVVRGKPEHLVLAPGGKAARRYVVAENKVEISRAKAELCVWLMGKGMKCIEVTEDGVDIEVQGEQAKLPPPVGIKEDMTTEQADAAARRMELAKKGEPYAPKSEVGDSSVRAEFDRQCKEAAQKRYEAIAKLREPDPMDGNVEANRVEVETSTSESDMSVEEERALMEGRIS